MDTLHKSIGILKYSIDNSGHKLIVSVDQQISEYYRSLIPKSILLQRQKYPAHISVIRKEKPVIMNKWNKYQGKQINFYYTHKIYWNTNYYWLNVFCVQLEEIRKELGLPISSPYTVPPDGFSKCFHMTIGNLKFI